VFDSAFIDHWKQRWEFMRQHMKLSVETIAAHQDLLLTSLPDRLAPRWQLLASITKKRADFKAEDHLTTLATLSDQKDFAQAFRADGEPNGMWQSNKAAVFCTFCSSVRKQSIYRHYTSTRAKSRCGTLTMTVSLTFYITL